MQFAPISIVVLIRLIFDADFIVRDSALVMKRNSLHEQWRGFDQKMFPFSVFALPFLRRSWDGSPAKRSQHVRGTSNLLPWSPQQENRIWEAFPSRTSISSFVGQRTTTIPDHIVELHSVPSTRTADSVDERIDSQKTRILIRIIILPVLSFILNEFNTNALPVTFSRRRIKNGQAASYVPPNISRTFPSLEFKRWQMNSNSIKHSNDSKPLIYRCGLSNQPR